MPSDCYQCLCGYVSVPSDCYQCLCGYVSVPSDCYQCVCGYVSVPSDCFLCVWLCGYVIDFYLMKRLLSQVHKFYCIYNKFRFGKFVYAVVLAATMLHICWYRRLVYNTMLFLIILL